MNEPNPETMKVMPWGKGQGDYVVINKADFDANVHKAYEPEKPVEKPTWVAKK